MNELLFNGSCFLIAIGMIGLILSMFFPPQKDFSGYPVPSKYVDFLGILGLFLAIGILGILLSVFSAIFL